MLRFDSANDFFPETHFSDSMLILCCVKGHSVYTVCLVDGIVIGDIVIDGFNCVIVRVIIRVLRN